MTIKEEIIITLSNVLGVIFGEKGRTYMFSNVTRKRRGPSLSSPDEEIENFKTTGTRNRTRCLTSFSL